MPSALDILKAVTDPKQLPEQLDRALLAQLLPEIIESKLSRDQVRVMAALEMLREWRVGFTKIMGDGLRTIKDESVKAREESRGVRAKLEAAQLQIQELQSDLRAAKEGRGLYEDKTRTELQRQLAAKEKLLEQATELQQTQRETIESLQAELRRQQAVVQRYEWDLSQLKNTSDTAAEQVRKDKRAMDELIKQARAALGQARDDITSRWGAELSPFMQAIYNNIVTALTRLPPPA